MRIWLSANLYDTFSWTWNTCAADVGVVGFLLDSAKSLVENRKSSSACARRSQSQGEKRNFFHFSWKLQTSKWHFEVITLLRRRILMHSVKDETHICLFGKSWKVEKRQNWDLKTGKCECTFFSFSLFRKIPQRIGSCLVRRFHLSVRAQRRVSFFLSFERKKPKVP